MRRTSMVRFAHARVAGMLVAGGAIAASAPVVAQQPHDGVVYVEDLEAAQQSLPALGAARPAGAPGGSRSGVVPVGYAAPTGRNAGAAVQRSKGPSIAMRAGGNTPQRGVFSKLAESFSFGGGSDRGRTAPPPTPTPSAWSTPDSIAAEAVAPATYNAALRAAAEPTTKRPTRTRSPGLFGLLSGSKDKPQAKPVPTQRGVAGSTQPRAGRTAQPSVSVAAPTGRERTGDIVAAPYVQQIPASPRVAQPMPTTPLPRAFTAFGDTSNALAGANPAGPALEPSHVRNSAERQGGAGVVFVSDDAATPAGPAAPRASARDTSARRLDSVAASNGPLPEIVTGPSPEPFSIGSASQQATRNSPVPAPHPDLQDGWQDAQAHDPAPEGLPRHESGAAVVENRYAIAPIDTPLPAGPSLDAPQCLATGGASDYASVDSPGSDSGGMIPAGPADSKAPEEQKESLASAEPRSDSAPTAPPDELAAAPSPEPESTESFPNTQPQPGATHARGLVAPSPHRERQSVALVDDRVATERARELLTEAHQLASSAASIEDFSAILQRCRYVLAIDDTAEAVTYANRLAGWALNKRGELLLDAAKPGEAEVDFLEALASDPSNWRAEHNLGVIEAQRGQSDSARARFDRTIQINPEYAKAYSNRAALSVQSGRFEDALDDYQRAIAADPDLAIAHTGRGRVCHLLGRLDEAQRHLDAAEVIDPEDTTVAVAQGDLLVDLGRYTQARQRYQRAIELEPGRVSARRNLAWLLATCPEEAIRDAAESLRQIHEAEKLTHADDDLLLDTKAAALAAAGRFDEAAVVARRAAEVAPDAEAAAYRERLALYEAKKPFLTTPVGLVRQASFDGEAAAR